MANGFNPNGVWQANGRGFNMGVLQHPGQVIHFTGQVAWDAQENIVGANDVEEQTRQCFRNILTILKSVGGNIEDIVSITTYFVDRADLPAIQRVRSEFLNSETAPTSTSIMVAGLGSEQFLVELAPIAVVPEERFIDPQ